MKKEMLKSLEKRFEHVETNEYTALATLLDPRFKNKFFTGTSEQENVKMLLKEKVELLKSKDNGAALSQENSVNLEDT